MNSVALFFAASTVSCAAAGFLLAGSARAGAAAAPLAPPAEPKSDAAGPPGKVKVYILMGENNMLGFGRVPGIDTPGTLEHLVKKKNKYRHLVDAAGNWVERRDVRHIHVGPRRGKSAVLRNELLSPAGGAIGPELGFGHVVGEFHRDCVLLLKSCTGNRSLGWDLLPPGSKAFTVTGVTYAGYKDTAPSWVDGQPKKDVDWYGGRQYDEDVAAAKGVLAELDKHLPGYQGQGWEIVGFVWWQGHKDQNMVHSARYEDNLVRLIESLRKDFNAPDAKFVLATGCGNPGREGFGKYIAEAQLAVDGRTGRHPRFKGNVRAVDSRPFWRDPEVSPKNVGHHYNQNAETFYGTGELLGRAMVELLSGK